MRADSEDQETTKMVRIFLACVGVLYGGLAAYCALWPAAAAQTVGLQLLPGSGDSEFLTVYGGLEAGLALSWLLPLFWPRLTLGALVQCTVIHACLVGFRSAGFALFSDIPDGTRQLAAGEWVLLILSALLLWRSRASLRAGSGIAAEIEGERKIR